MLYFFSWCDTFLQQIYKIFNTCYNKKQVPHKNQCETENKSGSISSDSKTWEFVLWTNGAHIPLIIIVVEKFILFLSIYFFKAATELLGHKYVPSFLAITTY